jgi:hypothetical protein
MNPRTTDPGMRRTEWRAESVLLRLQSIAGEKECGLFVIVSFDVRNNRNNVTNGACLMLPHCFWHLDLGDFNSFKGIPRFHCFLAGSINVLSRAHWSERISKKKLNKNK